MLSILAIYHHAPLLRKVYRETPEFSSVVLARQLLLELRCSDAGSACRPMGRSLCLVHVHQKRADKHSRP